MSSLVQDDLTRATAFFALAFGLTAVGGLAIGDLRLGVEYGLALGVGFAVFAYFFVAPTALDDDSDGAPGTANDPGADEGAEIGEEHGADEGAETAEEPEE